MDELETRHENMRAASRATACASRGFFDEVRSPFTRASAEEDPRAFVDLPSSPAPSGDLRSAARTPGGGTPLQAREAGRRPRSGPVRAPRRVVRDPAQRSGRLIRQLFPAGVVESRAW